MIRVWLLLLACCSCALAHAQSAAGTSGTLEGTVSDPSGAVIAGATVTIENRVTAFSRSVTSDASGQYRITGIPHNPYHMQVSAAGFQSKMQDISVRSAVPIRVDVTLQLAAEATSITVHSESSHLIENIPTAHTDIEQDQFNRLPAGTSQSGLSNLITLAAPGVVADSNGFFHPLGEHADTSYSIDNQPIADQQSRAHSNQLPLDAFQSVEVLSGAPRPEFGDKTSLVVNAITRSGLGLSKPAGSFAVQYGSFGSPAARFTFGIGGPKWGNFLAANGSRSGRYLDSPEFSPLHDIGNDQKFFDRADWQPATYDSLHLNLYLARSWFQIPNTWDQQYSGQDQRQSVHTWNVSPGWMHLFNATTSLNVTPFIREDHVQYFPSRDPFSDLPATIAQDRTLRNAGFKADVSYVSGIHNAKVGVQVMRTSLDEEFTFGITDPEFNSADNFQPGLVPYDLTRGGSPYVFRGHANINEEAVYAQDSVTLGHWNIMGGVRWDNYRGLSNGSAWQPRVGISYALHATGTVLRASYARLFSTPYNENLVLSSSTGLGGLAAGAFGAVPLRPGRRNQFNAGFQQAIGSRIVVDGDYFWKYTDNAFDFDTLFNTPITFPIEWRKSKIDGLAVRINLTNTRGLTAFTVMGHTRARVFGPEVGGLIFNSPVDFGVFRIDHDQAFEQTTNVQYQIGKNGPWIALTWRYDSGMVAGSAANAADVLALSADEQQQMGLFCGSRFATLGRPIRECPESELGATRVRIPAPGTENDDHNPPRIAPRHIFDLSAGIDNLFHTDHPRWTLRLSALNLTNKAALYNFLSTFSGTHFVSPRSYQAEVGLVF